MRTDQYHKQIAAKLIAAIEAGTAPWMKPWQPGESPRARNMKTGRHYRGINVIVLDCAALDGGHADPRWASFKQIRDAGGMVRKGEKGTPIIWAGYRSRAVRDDDGNPKKDANGRTIYATADDDGPPIWKVSHVFNVEQADGLTLPAIGPTQGPGWTAHERTDATINATGIKVRNVRGDRASYSPGADVITMPERDQFGDSLGYYHTLLHETVHATGHASRLDREKGNAFGTEAYAREELIAEIGAMIAGDVLGVGSAPQHGAAYVASWIKALREDPKEITRAASAAERAADWITRHAPQEETAAAAA